MQAVKVRAAGAPGGMRKRSRGVRDFEMRVVYLWTEPGGDGHVHTAVIDDNGDGLTVGNANHVHRIKGLEIAPAQDGHSHELGAERAPAVEYVRFCALLSPRKRKERRQ